MPHTLNAVFRRIPVLERLYLGLSNRFSSPFKTSSDYWERRYRVGGNSGAGSYNRLAEFKAEFLNHFVEQNRITTVIEFGCGDGAQLGLARYPQYIGVDISPKAVEMCRAIFSNDNSKIFLSATDVVPSHQSELALSLDVVYHLVEDEVFDTYMRRLFQSATRFVIVYSSNVDQDWPSPHVRHRNFTKWIETNAPHWRLQKSVPNAYPFDPEDPNNTSFADFFVFEPTTSPATPDSLHS